MLKTVYNQRYKQWVEILFYIVLCNGLQLPALAADHDILPVQTQKLEYANYPLLIHALGKLEVQSQILYFETSGYMTRILVKAGQSLVAGQLVAELDRRDINNKKSQSILSIAHAEAKRDRARKLQKRQVSTEDELDNREYDYALRQLELKNLEVLYKRHFLKAPAAGRVLQRFVEFPQPIDVNTPIISMKSTQRPWRFSAYVTPAEANLIQIGDSVQIRFDGLMDKPVMGQVEQIAGSTASNDHLFEIKITLQQAPSNLRAGLNARVDIQSSQQRQGYLMPFSALLNIAQHQAKVFVLKRDIAKAIKHTVQFEFFDRDRVLVTTDLSDYKQVVIGGQQNLQANTP